VQSGVQTQALLAPQSAVSRDAQGHATAMVLGRDGKVQARVLQTGGVVQGQWLVTSGLAAGDRLIVDGLQRLRPGMAAQVAATAGATGATTNGTAR